MQPEGAGPQLSRMVDALRAPGAYPHPVPSVDVIQTHVSYVLLAGEHAYKIKKPLDLGFLDYSTLARRRELCEEEVRLNRRLCDGVYLGVVAVTRDVDAFRIGGAGEPVEYAVHMRRVPHERMLDAMLAAGEAPVGVVRAVARKMAVFHGSAATDARIQAFGTAAQVRANWDENFDQLARLLGGGPRAEAVETLRTYAHRFLDREAALIDGRASGGRVRDCHGDLRSDAVYAGEDGGVCIMDCIEFNDRIRYGDVAGDIAFLAMDLRYRGHPELADELLGAYLTASSDETLPLVLGFYACYRAVVRAKVEAIRAAEAEVPRFERTSARAAADAYLRLALEYTAERAAPVLLYMVGLSGTGKSYLADALACRAEAVVLSTDALRGRAGGRAPAFATGRYSAEQREAVYVRLREAARVYLLLGRAVVLDATHLARGDRDAARALAAECGVPSIAVEITAADEVVRAHFAEREQRSGAASEATWETYLAQREAMETLAPDERPSLTVDVSAGLSANVDRIMEAIGALQGI